MTATHVSKAVSVRHTFQVEHEGKSYDVVIWLDEKGKFDDGEISYCGEELDFEGTNGDIREAITNFLDEKWDDLVKE